MYRLATIAAALLPLAASAQTRSLVDRALGVPTGIAVPGAGVAGAEEPTALSVNPAGVGFVGGLTFQYLREGEAFGFRSGGALADGAYVALPIGPLVPALSMEWMRPGEGRGARYRKTTFGLGLASGQALSLGVAWDTYASPDRDLDHASAFGIGVTVRPSRNLSFAASALGISSRLGERPLPVRYAFGAGVRLLSDRLTLTGDLLADDGARGTFQLGALALGLAAELPWGLGVLGQVQFPVRAGQPSPADQPAVMLALSFNRPHAGVLAGGSGRSGADSLGLLGVRLSSQRYRALEGWPRGRVEVVDLARELRPRSSWFSRREADPLAALASRLAGVRDDPGTVGLIVKIDALPVGQAQAEELRSALLAVRGRKPVLAWLFGGGLKEYHLATASTALYAAPAAPVMLAGISSQVLFLKEGLARIGVAFEVVAAGRYKSAPDPLVRGDMGEAQRQATNSVLDDLFARQVRGIAEARGLTEGRVRELVDIGLFTPQEAREAGLVDGAAWPDELEEAMRSRAGRSVALSEGHDASPARSAERWGPRPAIAVVRIAGMIVQGRSRRSPFGGDALAGDASIREEIRAAASDRSVKAIVLRIDSPGGDALASDLIWREVALARRAGKVVVASMSDLAASGGYYVACAADVVLAEPSTLTGSIGVFGVKPDLSGLLAKLGVNPVTLKRGKSADVFSPTRGWTEEERALLEKLILASYDLFLSRVAEGRKLGREELERAAGGRIWTGEQALGLRLVDGLGSQEDAVALAAARAGIALEDASVRRAKAEGLLGSIAAGAAGAFAQDDAMAGLAARVPELRTAALLLEMGPVVALPVEWVDVR